MPDPEHALSEHGDFTLIILPVVLSAGCAVRLAAALANQELFIADGNLAGLFTAV
jgi:hypothetical protein